MFTNKMFYFLIYRECSKYSYGEPSLNLNQPEKVELNL